MFLYIFLRKCFIKKKWYDFVLECVFYENEIEDLELCIEKNFGE